MQKFGYFAYYILIYFKVNSQDPITCFSHKMENQENKSHSFLQIPTNSDFSMINIPFGVFSTNQSPNDLRCATRIGNLIKTSKNENK